MQLTTWKFDNAVDGVKGEQSLQFEKQTTISEATLHETLAHLSKLLNDQGVIASMWPESADESDMGLY